MSTYRQLSHESGHREFLIKIFALAILSWLLVSAGLYLLLKTQSNLFRQPLLPLAWLLISWIGVRSLLGLITEAARGLQIFWLASLSGGQQEGPLVNLMVTVLLLLMGSNLDDAKDVLLIHFITTSSVLLLTVYVLRRAIKRPSAKSTPSLSQNADNKPSLGSPSTISVVSESAVVLISQVSILGLVEFETLLVGRFCDDDQIGAWGAIRRVLTVVSAPLLFINAAIPGFIAELYDRREMVKLEKMLRAASTIATPPAVLAFALLFFAGDRVLQFFEPSFLTAWPSLALLAAANVVFVGAGSAGLALRMTGNQARTTVTTIALSASYFLVAPWVVAKYEIWGAAVLSACLIVFRNTISTVMVRTFIGVRCTPSFRISDAYQLLESLKRKRRPRQESDDKPVAEQPL